MTDSPRRLIAIMFTDIVGYSTMTQRDEAMTLDLLSKRGQRQLFFETITKANSNDKLNNWRGFQH